MVSIAPRNQDCLVRRFGTYLNVGIREGNVRIQLGLHIRLSFVMPHQLQRVGVSQFPFAMFWTLAHGYLTVGMEVQFVLRPHTTLRICGNGVVHEDQCLLRRGQPRSLLGRSNLFRVDFHAVVVAQTAWRKTRQQLSSQGYGCVTCFESISYEQHVRIWLGSARRWARATISNSSHGSGLMRLTIKVHNA